MDESNSSHIRNQQFDAEIRDLEAQLSNSCVVGAQKPRSADETVTETVEIEGSGDGDEEDAVRELKKAMDEDLCGFVMKAVAEEKSRLFSSSEGEGFVVTRRSEGVEVESSGLETEVEHRSQDFVKCRVLEGEKVSTEGLGSGVDVDKCSQVDENEAEGKVSDLVTRFDHVSDDSVKCRVVEEKVDTEGFGSGEVVDKLSGIEENEVEARVSGCGGEIEEKEVGESVVRYEDDAENRRKVVGDDVEKEVLGYEKDWKSEVEENIVYERVGEHEESREIEVEQVHEESGVMEKQENDEYNHDVEENGVEKEVLLCEGAWGSEVEENKVEERVVGHEESRGIKEDKVQLESSGWEEDGVIEKGEIDECNGDVEENECDTEEERSEEEEGRVSGSEKGKDGMPRKFHYPLRPDAEDCSFYMKTGACKFGLNCKFNHPLSLRKKSQVTKESFKHKEETYGRPAQTECKYYLSSGGCKYGKACKYNHSRDKAAVAPVVEFNFLGLPIRVGERECPYYMRNGSCKYGSNCKYNHPDPTTIVGGDLHVSSNGVSVPLAGAAQTTEPSWSSPEALNGTTPFVPMAYPQSQGISSQTPEWSGYQAPVYPTSERSPFNPTSERSHVYPTLDTRPVYLTSEKVSVHPATERGAVYSVAEKGNVYPKSEIRPANTTSGRGPVYPASERGHLYPTSVKSLPTPPAFVMSNSSQENLYTHHQRMPVEEFPERPGQLECSYFMKTGDCKYRSACKFHHPKTRFPRTSSPTLSDKGLPLRPGQTLCSHYSRYGICKYGPACKFDHPVNDSISDSAGGSLPDGPSMVGARTGRESLIY